MTFMFICALAPRERLGADDPTNPLPSLKPSLLPKTNAWAPIDDGYPFKAVRSTAFGKRWCFRDWAHMSHLVGLARHWAGAGCGRLDRAGRSARLSSLRGPAQSAFL